MLINEIFYSISGESIQSGRPAIFIRAFGCPLRCSFCDSLYAVEGDDYKEMSIDEILDEVSKYKCRYIVLTGGEPLIQKDCIQLIKTLNEHNYHVEVETCGAVDIIELLKRCRNVTVTMDWKCPSSGMTSKMISENLSLLRYIDVLKCVVGSKEDLEEMKKVASKTKAQVFVSPVFDTIPYSEIVEYILENNLDVRFQLQIHKFVWDKDKRGV